MHKRLILLFVFALLAVPVSAQTSTPSPALDSTEVVTTQETTDSKPLKIRTREELQAEKMRMQEQQAERKEATMEKREAFTEKITEVKDQRKQVALENLDERIVVINKVITDRMLKNLDTMEEILGRIQTKVDGVDDDTTVVQTAIDEAKIAIDAARVTVEDQQAKEYVLEISNETALKTDARTLIQQLKADLKMTHEVVKGAREAVVMAAREMAKVMGEKPAPSTTIAPTVTPEVTPETTQ